MEAVDKKETIVLIPLGALEQHGNQAPLGTDDIIAEAMCEYLTEALEEAELREIVSFACTAAGFSTTKHGGIQSVPELDDVIRSMR